ncbi:hypothetical protein [Sphingomonas sp.]|uniref:hypothetical protein n=1 Tax=Sphingomonas sp. TaxID=28214 RepID=UPI00307CD653
MTQALPSGFERRSIASDPTLSSFAATFRFEAWNGMDLAQAWDELDLSSRLLEPYRLLAIPYFEWSFETEELAALFGVLTRTGSMAGWAIPLYRRDAADDACLRHLLDRESADWLAHEHLPFEPTILLDDRFKFALLTWHTDEAYLCLTPDLFGLYLGENPTNYDLYGDGSAASDFEQALDQAFGRLDRWRIAEDESRLSRGARPLTALSQRINRLRNQRSDTFN